MNWFIRLFKKKEIEENKEERVLDIKEPVYSFVACFKSNPRRFKIMVLSQKQDSYYEHVQYVTYQLQDKVTGKNWTVTKRYNREIEMYLRGRDYPSFLTYDEVTLIIREIENCYKKRLHKIRMYKEGLIGFKNDRVKEREQLMKDYCGDSQ